jgi:nucleoid-associated protein YgaU
MTNKINHTAVGQEWSYTVKPGDGLMAIVRKEFKLKDPQDTQEIGRLVNLIVAQNGIKNRDRINVGTVLTLRNYSGEGSPDGEKKWSYTVKPGDGLMAIVRKEFKLKDPKDTQEIGRLVNLIVAQNDIKDQNRIKPGDTLTLHY